MRCCQDGPSPMRCAVTRKRSTAASVPQKDSLRGIRRDQPRLHVCTAIVLPSTAMSSGCAPLESLPCPHGEEEGRTTLCKAAPDPHFTRSTRSFSSSGGKGWSASEQLGPGEVGESGQARAARQMSAPAVHAGCVAGAGVGQRSRKPWAIVWNAG